MRTLYLLIVIYAALIMSGCNVTRTPVPPTSYVPPKHYTPHSKHKCHHHKDPVNVSFLNKNIPNRPFKVLGEAEVSKFNSEGIKRQDATIRDLIREQAASLDGDAIIDIKNDGQKITATVIAYKKDLV